jgi:hypothetical protein
MISEHNAIRVEQLMLDTKLSINEVFECAISNLALEVRLKKKG